MQNTFWELTEIFALSTTKPLSMVGMHKTYLVTQYKRFQKVDLRSLYLLDV